MRDEPALNKQKEPGLVPSFYVYKKVNLHVVVDLKRVVEVEEVLHLVVGDAAIDHRLLARVHDDERQLEGRTKN